jgi:thiamine biosynthesis protein ThiI
VIQLDVTKIGVCSMKREKVVCLVSGGIDSPVACALVAKRFDAIPLHFCLSPFASEDSFFLAMNILRDMKKIVGFEKVIVYPWGPILDAITKDDAARSHTCVLCKRGMFKVAEKMCKIEGASAIMTGESLGQKATQTLRNLRATSAGVKFPILRPLLGLDKNEIEAISKKLGIWHERHTGCCYATPRYPTTGTNQKVLDDLFSKLGLDAVIERNFGKILEVKTFKEDFECYLKSLRK